MSAALQTVDDFPSILRARAIARLKLMKTMAGDCVDDTRVSELQADDSPRIMVYGPTQRYESIGDAPPQYRASGILKIDGYVSGAPQAKVNAATELMGRQILQLMNDAVFLEPPMERIAAIDMTYNVIGNGDRFEGWATMTLDVRWTEIFEPMLANLDGSLPVPWAAGAPLDEIDTTITTPGGVTLSSATQTGLATATTETT